MWWRVDEPGNAGRWRTPVSPTPKAQLGFVRLWSPRALDVRLFWGADARIPPEISEEESDAGEGTLGFDEPDELARRLALALQVPPGIWLRDEGALEWADDLYAYQKAGILAILDSRQLLLGDEMGLGKSVQTIAALRILLHRREIERALVVVPASLVEQWKREWYKWAPEIVVLPIGGRENERRWQWRYRAHVTLVSYETLRSDADLKRGPLQQKWGVVVLDEAQKIKNAESETAVICKKLPRVRSLALTGTPIENHIEDLSSLLEFLFGHRVGRFSLRSTLAQVLVRRTKSQVLPELPPKLYSDLLVPLSPAQRHAYEQAEREGTFSLRGGPISIQSILALLTRLKQICNFDPYSGDSAKVDDLRSRLGEVVESGQKALIFTQFSGDSGARRLTSALSEWNPLMFTGDLASHERTAVLDRFAEDEAAQVLILSLKAGAQGLNLQSASYIFHFDRWWNPAVESQAESRAHRLGQERPVHIYRYISPDTIEERIDAVLQQKAALFDHLIEDTALDTELPWSREDLLRVAGLA
ncbi:RNA polymerase-associated protein RapA [Abditibacteriota bacterium]|nr:RNA polymerase-associated protein RapA [Abditibacteriota bacterium]